MRRGGAGGRELLRVGGWGTEGRGKGGGGAGSREGFLKMGSRENSEKGRKEGRWELSSEQNISQMRKILPLRSQNSRVAEYLYKNLNFW